MNNQRKVLFGILALVVVVVLGVIYFFFGPSANDRMVVTNAIENIKNEDLNFSFSYESGETALSSMETPNQTEDKELLKMYVLMQSEALDEFNKNKEAGSATEAPPAISILVFNRATTTEGADVATTSIDKIKQWAEANSKFTSINLVQGNVEEAKVDGASAIHYKADGLYSQDVYVVKYGKKMYLFVGQSLEDGDYMQTAFSKLMKTVIFE
jgi:hypothetical protein